MHTLDSFSVQLRSASAAAAFLLVGLADHAAAQIPTQIPFSGCGTLTQGANCTLFAADSGGSYLLEDFGTFQVNDRVFVDGQIEVFCLSICEVGAGCILQNTISGCTTPPPVSFCFGDGSSTTPCPCNNESPTPFTGCVNSTGIGGTLGRSGSASVGNDSLVLLGGGMPNSSALYFQGTTRIAGGNGAVFGDGLRCVGGTIVRLATKTNTGFGTLYPESGEPKISVLGGVSAGDLRFYQIWYRNADPSWCTSATFNLTNALELTWTP